MVEQHGTLKYGTGGYYFVLSLPIQALNGVDDDGDGLLNSTEFRVHYESIMSSVEQGFLLESTSIGRLPIEGLIINVSHNHNDSHKPASHVVAMGRFNVDSDVQDLILKTSLFGVEVHEKRYKMTVTRGTEKEKIVLSNTHPTHRIFGQKK
jgi:hypothetical protein